MHESRDNNHVISENLRETNHNVRSYLLRETTESNDSDIGKTGEPLEFSDFANVGLRHRGRSKKKASNLIKK